MPTLTLLTWKNWVSPILHLRILEDPHTTQSDLCKLYLYGGLNHIRSSRKLERECKTNLEAIWLLKGLMPDFKTIADFRKDNPAAIVALFKDFVAFLKNLSLYGAKQSPQLMAQNCWRLTPAIKLSLKEHLQRE